MKLGTKFTHKHWLDINKQPLQCVVTRVAQGVVYWRAEGDCKARHYFHLEEAAKYVKDLK